MRSGEGWFFYVSQVLYKSPYISSYKKQEKLSNFVAGVKQLKGFG